jgi:hypothetical protein
VGCRETTHSNSGEDKTLNAYTPPLAPVVVLAFLATAGLLCLLLLALLIGFWRKSRVLRLGSLLAALLLVTVYAGMLLWFSLSTREVVLPEGGKKYFCEIDCHIAYSVQGAMMAANVGGELQPVASNGNFVVVGVKSRFDPATISPRRGDGPLTPNRRQIALVDESGRSIAPSGKQERVLHELHLHSTPLTAAIRPGESYVSYFVFEVPSSTVNPKLLLTSKDEETVLLWGHENSYFHKKIYFALPQDLRSATLR